MLIILHKIFIIFFIIILIYFNNNLSEIKYKIIKNKLHKITLYKEDEKDKLNNKTIINICMALDNNIIYPTLVSMVSALENNNNEKNILAYYLLLSDDFNKNNVLIFESLKRNYSVIINYYIIPNIFGSFKKWAHGTICHYYKIIIPMLFPYLERILFLDSDTLIFKDLSKMYKLNFNDNYIIGSQAGSEYINKNFKSSVKVYINSGVLLFNIKKIRKFNKDIELLYFTMKRNKIYRFPEQDCINVIFNPKIGLFPYEWGMRIIDSLKTYIKYLEPTYKIKYPINEVNNAISNPGLVHLLFCYPKIFHRITKYNFKNNTICYKYQKIFFFYAKKTQYLHKIYYNLFKKL